MFKCNVQSCWVYLHCWAANLQNLFISQNCISVPICIFKWLRSKEEYFMACENDMKFTLQCPYWKFSGNTAPPINLHLVCGGFPAAAASLALVMRPRGRETLKYVLSGPLLKKFASLKASLVDYRFCFSLPTTALRCPVYSIIVHLQSWINVADLLALCFSINAMVKRTAVTLW